MKTFFGINRSFARDAFKIALDYSLDEVEDTLALNRPQPTPGDFLEKFNYVKSGGERLEDEVANSLGWWILSSRLVEVLQDCRNVCDIELLCLPKKVIELDGRLRDYRVLGIKRHIKCVDYGESDILFDSQEHILSFRECVLSKRNIPDHMDIFLMAEYPVVPVISAELALKISELRPTGFVYEKIKAV